MGRHSETPRQNTVVGNYKSRIKTAFSTKIVRLIVAIPPVIYILVHAILIYIYNQKFQGENLGDHLPFNIDSAFFQPLSISDLTVSLSVLIALLVIFGGAGLIANRSQAQCALTLFV